MAFLLNNTAVLLFTPAGDGEGVQLLEPSPHPPWLGVEDELTSKLFLSPPAAPTGSLSDSLLLLSLGLPLGLPGVPLAVLPPGATLGGLPGVPLVLTGEESL